MSLNKKDLEAIQYLLRPLESQIIKIQANVETLSDDMNRRFNIVDQRFNLIDQRFNVVDQNFDALFKSRETSDQEFLFMNEQMKRLEKRVSILEDRKPI